MASGPYYPDKRAFVRLAKSGNLIPVWRDILADLETPVSAFLKLGDRPYAYLLESAEGGETLGRFSFLGGRPSLVMTSRGKRITVRQADGSQNSFETEKDPLFELERLMKRYRPVPVKGLPPFSGGAVGYLGYDMVRFIEKIPAKNPDVLGLPDSLFIFTDTLLAFDHLNHRIRVVCNACTDDFDDPADAYDDALARIEDEIRRLRSAPAPGRRSAPRSVGGSRVESNFTKAGFLEAVRRAKGHIKKGDIFQVVLSQAFRTGVRSQPFEVYRALRSVNPSPYMFYINGGDFQLVGSSPEVHVRCEGATASLRPIAGTRKRGTDAREDALLEKELKADPKERAEHVMLVDLGRNDLGRVCEYNTVRVKEFMTVERYSHVMHLVSHVEGRLKKDKSRFDLLRATFPAGTVSGSPKVRAMQIIDELENRKRGFYSGIVGYFSYTGNLDSCIAIRSIIVKGGTATVQAGAGVVADSNPEKEFEETCNKAKGMLKAVEVAESGVDS